MSDLGAIEMMGTVMKVLGNNNYSVEVGETEEQKREILCHLGGKMRRFRINIIPGDEVTLDVPPPYDKGRITFRGKKEDRFVSTGRQKRTKDKKKPKGKGGRR